MSRFAEAMSQFTRAFLLVFLQRAWQGFAGLVTVWLIATHLSIADQGWYYAFLSLAACASFFDLGMSVVVLQTSARAAALRHSGQSAIGLRELMSGFQHFYRWVIIAFIAFGISAGWFAFSVAAADAEKLWWWPWLMLLALTAANLWFVPHLAIWEGAGDVAQVYGLRLLQGVAGSVLTWAGLFFGDPLWATCISPGVSLVFVAGFTWRRRRNIEVDGGWRPDDLSQVSALRWRVAASWIAGYLLIQISPPVLMRFGLVAESGRMGLSLALVNMVGILALSIMTPLVPKMAALAEHGNHRGLDDLFRKAFVQACVFYLLLAAILLCAVFFVQGSSYAIRILPLWSFIALLVAAFCSHILGCLALYLRSYYREPFAPLMLVMAGLSLASLFIIAPLYGSAIYVFVFLVLQLVIAVPTAFWIFLRQRRACQT